jgi:hypothetical protein
MEIDPRHLHACTNQVDLHVRIAEHDESIGGDPRSAADSARRVGERCLAIDARYYRLLDQLAQAQLVFARHLAETGGDPMAALTSAGGYLDRAEAAEHEPVAVWYHRVITANTEATFLLHQGRDPASSIAVGRTALAKAVRLMPRAADIHVEALTRGHRARNQIYR